MRPCGWVYFAALSSRLAKTCCTAPGSQETVGEPSGRSTLSSSSLLRKTGRMPSAASRTMASAGWSENSYSRALTSICDSVIRSEVSCVRRRAFCHRILTKRSLFSLSWMAPSSRVSAYPAMDASGVRSSWDTLITKSRRIWSIRSSSVMSWNTAATARTLPLRLKIGAQETRQARWAGVSTENSVVHGSRLPTTLRKSFAISFDLQDLMGVSGERSSSGNILSIAGLCSAIRPRRSRTRMPSPMPFTAATNRDRSSFSCRKLALSFAAVAVRLEVRSFSSGR